MENYIIANCTDTGRTRRVNEDSMVTFDSPNGRVVAVWGDRMQVMWHPS